MDSDPCGWVKLYHPSGVQVTLPLLPDASEEYAASFPPHLFKQCTAYLEAGFLVNAPGLEEGEQIEEVGAVLRSEFEKDGETTPVLLLYSTNDKLEWAFLKVYLNKDEDIAAFQKASGMKLQDLPIYEGQDKLKWDESKLARKYIVKPPRPFKAVMKKNPRYSEEDRKAAIAKKEVYKIPARFFVRWDGAATAASLPAGEQEDRAAFIAKEVAWWKQFFHSDPSLEEVSDHVRRLISPMEDKVLRAAIVAEAIDPWKAQTGAEWDKNQKKFLPPREPDPPEDNSPF